MECLQQNYKSGLPNRWKVIKGQFSITRFLGRGSYGEVVKARHRSTKKVYAIKMINVNQQNPFQMKNLVRELSILRQLTKMKNNVFTIKLHSVILPEAHAKFDDIDKLDHIFIVTDFMETDIQKLVQITQPDNFDQSHQLAIIYNFLCAMNFLHSANIMHRDLKSENVLIDDECRIKICDFGMARSFLVSDLSKDYDKGLNSMEKREPDCAGIQECLSRNVCTKWYRAPELVILQDNYNSKVDMWGFGCILAELSFLNVVTPVENRDKILFICQKELTEASEANLKETMSAEDDFNLETIDNQLMTIIGVIGKQSDANLSFIKDSLTRDHFYKVQNLAVVTESGRLENRLAHADGELMYLIKNLLKFNPDERYSAEQALKLPLFDKIRDTVLEQPASGQVQIECDDFDGSQGGTTTGDNSLKEIVEYKKLFIKELLRLVEI